MSRWTAGVITVLAVMGCLGTGGAEAAPPSRVNGDLMALYAEHVARGGGPGFRSENRLARIVDNQRVVVDAVADGDVNALVSTLRGLGMQGISVFGRVVSGELPIRSIPALHGVAGLRFARPSYVARRAGLVTSQGDQAMHSDVARGVFGVNGAGVTVGVLSDSFDCLHEAATDVQTGDLPAGVQVIQDISNCRDGTDEGRAMLQIVHDIAPGAPLAFASAFNGEASFANNILALQSAGAKVIADDVAYFNEPMFQDGIIAQAVNTVKSQGSAYFSAAGNEARQSYESGFRPGATFTDGQFPSRPGLFPAPHFRGGVAHNFASSGPPQHFQRITIPANSQLIITFQWDSPFFSAGGAGSPNDVDIYLLNSSLTRVEAGSTDDNIGNDAVEVFTFTNHGATADFNLMIVSFAGPQPGFIKYIQEGDSDIVTQQFNTASSSLFGHPNALGAAAVGAAFFLDTPAFGTSPPRLESFSSSGPTPILFDTSGTRLATPVVPQKPDIVAPDGVNTTFFVQDSPQDPDSFPNFFGTSAAAPHAAGVAALLLQLRPGLSPDTIYATMKATAIDMGPPGFDFDSGSGLIQADAALTSLSLPLAAAVLPSSRSVQIGATATAFATVINAGTTTAVGVSVALATQLPGSFAYQTTDRLTNQTDGLPNTPVNIPAGGSQTFALSITPSAAMAPTEVAFAFTGVNTVPAPVVTGVNTLLLSASATPTPDVVALAATPSGDLITDIPGPNGTAVFSVASVNVGAGGSITVSTDTGAASLPLSVVLCQTDPNTALCFSPPTPTVNTTIAAGATPTFSFFVTGAGAIPFDPANNRIFIRFKDAGNVTRGSTSTAVRTQ